MINHKHKFIFVRVAKNASTSIINLLPKLQNCCSGWKYDDSHIPMWYLEENLDKDIIDTYFKFAFVRNPFERIVSAVKYENQYWLKNNPCVHFEFKKFVSSFNNKPNPTHLDNVHSAKYGSQYDFTKGCDFIGRYENLQNDFNIICDKIGIPHQQLPHQNKTKHKHYTEYYDDETREIVAEKYAKDIEYFGYRFGE